MERINVIHYKTEREEKSEKQLLSNWVPIPALAISEITVCLILSLLLLQAFAWSQ